MYHPNVRFNAGGEYRLQKNSLDSLFSFFCVSKTVLEWSTTNFKFFKISQKKKKEHRRQTESK